MATPRLPSITNIWQFDINNLAALDTNTADNNRKTLYQIKASLVGFTTNPWTVHSSSNGSTAGSSDLWTDYQDVNWSAGNYSWIVLTKPTTGSQILISCGLASSNDMMIYWSPQGLFTGGSISSNPTATDQITLQASGTWNAGQTAFSSFVHVWHTSDGSKTRVLVTTDTASSPGVFWLFDEIDTVFSDSWATTPEIVLIIEGANCTKVVSSLYLSPLSNAGKSWDETNGFDVVLFSLGHDSVSTGGQNWESFQIMGSIGNQLNVDEPYPMMPVGVASETVGFRGVHGVISDLYFGHQDRADGTTYPISTTSKTWVQSGDLILPWTGGSDIPFFDATVTQGVVVDESSNSNDGTPTNIENGDFVIDTVGGFSTRSVSLGGTNEYILIGDVSPLQFDRTDPFSISCWFKTTSSASISALVSKLDSTSPNPGYELSIDTSGMITWQLVNSIVTNEMRIDTTSSGWNDGVWHHVVVTWDGDVAGGVSGATIYIDDSSQSVTTTANTLTGSISTSTPLQFGARDGANFALTGSLDDISIYDKELSSTEVSTIYNSKSTVDLRVLGPTASLVGYWLMGEGVIETSATENTVNGVLVGVGATAEVGTTAVFRMVGIDEGSPSQPYYHYWTVTIEPDSTGAQTTPPFGGPLTNIYVSAKWTEV